MDGLSRYIFVYYTQLLTVEEYEAWMDIIHEEKKQIYSCKSRKEMEQKLEQLKNKPQDFFEKVTNRVIKEHSDKIFFNYCPKCGKLAKTPRAKQCANCKYDWH